MAQTIQAIELFEELKGKLGEQVSKRLISYIDSKVEEKAATKTDLKSTEEKLRGEIKDTEERLRKEIKDIEEKLRKEIKDTEERLRKEIRELRKLLLYVLIPISTAIGAIVGSLIARLH